MIFPLHLFIFACFFHGVRGQTCSCSTLDSCATTRRTQQQQAAANCINSCSSNLGTLANSAANIRLCYTNAENQLYTSVSYTYRTCLGPSGRGCSTSSGGTTTNAICRDGQRATGICNSANNYQCPTGTTCTTGNMCCVSGTSICPNNQRPTGTCFNNAICPSGSTCNQGQCCPGTTSQCPSNVPVFGGACTNGQCNTGFNCYLNSVCCRPSSAVCPAGQQSFSFCTNNQCTTGTCNNGVCCQSTTSQCPSTQPFFGGNCINGQCSAAGFSCYNNAVCCRPATATCPAGQTSSGFCNNNQCTTAGAVCTNGACCSSSTSVCPNNVASNGACLNGLCAGLDQCLNGLCCPTTGTTCTNGTPSLGSCTTGAVPSTCPPGSVCTNNVCCALRRSGRKKRQTTGLLGPLTAADVSLSANVQAYDNCVRTCNTQATQTTFDAVCSAQNACTVSAAAANFVCTSQTQLKRNSVKTSFCSCLTALGISCTAINAG